MLSRSCTPNLAKFPFLARMSSTLPKHNPYFKLGGKDVWSLINETAAKAEESGEKVINLGQGFFSYSPPDFAISGVKNAVDNAANNQYAHTRGKPNLLNALADRYSSIYNRKVGTNEIQVTTGANEGMFSIFVGFLEKGDEVIVFEPFFDQYISNIELAGGKVVYVPINPPSDFDKRNVRGDEWTINFDQLKGAINSKTKMIIINTPHNPIGKIFTEEELIKIGDLAVQHNLLIVSDEVYENLYYTSTFPRISQLSPKYAERTFTVGSAGKSFAATGWRIGWIIGNPELLSYVTLAHCRICFSSPAPLQEAVASALKEAEGNNYFEITRQEYKRKYEKFTKVFDDLGLPYTIAEGGYFLLVNFSKVKIPSTYDFPDDFKVRAKDFKLAYWLIKEFGVVSIPPTEFYIDEHESAAEDCLRFAVCKDDELLEKAGEKLRGLKKYLA